MTIDLLCLRDLEPPTGDLSVRPSLAFTRAVWTQPIAGEDGAPKHRIIHSRCLQLHGPTELVRLGVRRVPGYHKCGSGQELDWPTSFRVWIWEDGSWRLLRQETSFAHPDPDAPRWFDLGAAETSAVILETRRCAVDGWWTSWPLVSKTFILEGRDPGPPAPRRERLLRTERLDLAHLPPGMEASVQDGRVRYVGPRYAVGFTLSGPGISSLSVHGPPRNDVTTGAMRRTERDFRMPEDPRAPELMRSFPGVSYQGPTLHPVGGPPVAAPALRFDFDGSVEVDGPLVRYALESHDHRLDLEWEIRPDELVLTARRSSDVPVRVWEASVWSLAFDIRSAPPHLLGRPVRKGRTGAVDLPAWLDVPAVGSLRITMDEGRGHLRFEPVRHLDMTALEVRLGETPGPLGDALLEAGEHRLRLRWKFDTLESELRAGAPDAVREAVQKRYLTALTYRPDTATLSNNGASIHCPISMDGWAAVTTRREAPLLPGVRAVDFLRDSLERWLDGGPGYASGPLLREEGLRPAEDEYIMTGTAALLGLADFLERDGSDAWLDRFGVRIAEQLAAMKRRDLDGDGLVESPYRTGVSGTGQWSTCWFDVISFGWKDAFANALLYPAIRKLDVSLPGPMRGEINLEAWASSLKDSYFDTFFNPDTGWMAGWRCKEDRLHDHAFLAVNGAAVHAGLVPESRKKDVMQRLWDEYRRVGAPDPVLGLPGNLWPIPDEDLADIMQGYPMGYYQNGGTTQSQSRHFVAGLYSAGLEDEADHLLERLCRGLADARVFGGCKSGIDWRYWDGRPCGYEGLLTDQFGILGLALERYGIRDVETADRPQHP